MSAVRSWNEETSSSLIKPGNGYFARMNWKLCKWTHLNPWIFYQNLPQCFILTSKIDFKMYNFVLVCREEKEIGSWREKELSFGKAIQRSNSWARRSFDCSGIRYIDLIFNQAHYFSRILFALCRLDQNELHMFRRMFKVWKQSQFGWYPKGWNICVIFVLFLRAMKT